MTLEEKMMQAVEQSVLATVKKAEWLRIDYQDRVVIPAADLRRIYDGLDMQRVIDGVRDRVEQHMADSIMNSMATEAASDIKQILSNKEMREDVRAVVRLKLREFVSVNKGE